MNTFDITKKPLGSLLNDIVTGKTQLPDFQRDWVWDEERIRELLISVGRCFPIGAVLMLEHGGNFKFKTRPIKGIKRQIDNDPDSLILDGQQRLTALTQAIAIEKPVRTRGSKGRKINRHYYFDIKKAIENPAALDKALVAVDNTRKLYDTFGKNVLLDLSTREFECKALCFPCNKIMNSDSWEDDLDEYAPHLSTTFRAFRTQVLECFRHYHVPVIELDKDTPLEAICTIFEKVNTGGVSLTVFELLTAIYAAKGCNLRRDWESRKRLIEESSPLLKGIQSTTFLKGISLLHTYDPPLEAEDFIKKGRTRPVSAKGADLLKIPPQSWCHWAPKLTGTGFPNAASFLQERCFSQRKDVPYASQLVPLAAVLTRLKDRWREYCVIEKIEKWFWCGVFGELYGGSVDTRMANDFEELLDWIENEGDLPRTVIEANFQSERLNTLRTRNSAAYKGVSSLVLKSGARDWFWKASMCDLNVSDARLDIHHIFPVTWCRKQGIPRDQYQSVLNKTPISYKANRMIGGKAPSDYISRLRDKIGLNDAEMDDILETHALDPDLLRRDEFTDFLQDRSVRLCRLIEGAMGKRVGEALEA